MLKRRRQQKTDYRQRLALLRSCIPRLVVRRSLNNFHLQVIEFHEKGDKVIAEYSSRSLRSYGWLGHCGNTPAAYLAGLVIGLKSQKKGVKKAIADIGLHNSIKGSSLFAVVLGAKDAGLDIPLGKEILPSQDRISGKHLADYASALKKESQEKYRKQFSSYLKNNLNPENIQEHFAQTKEKIIEMEKKE